MEVVTLLEEKMNVLFNEIQKLRQENQQLSEELELERMAREEVQSRIHTLLEKIQTEIE